MGRNKVDFRNDHDSGCWAKNSVVGVCGKHRWIWPRNIKKSADLSGHGQRNEKPERSNTQEIGVETAWN